MSIKNDKQAITKEIKFLPKKTMSYKRNMKYMTVIRDGKMLA